MLQVGRCDSSESSRKDSDAAEHETATTSPPPPPENYHNNQRGRKQVERKALKGDIYPSLTPHDAGAAGEAAFLCSTRRFPRGIYRRSGEQARKNGPSREQHAEGQRRALLGVAPMRSPPRCMEKVVGMDCSIHLWRRRRLHLWGRFGPPPPLGSTHLSRCTACSLPLAHYVASRQQPLGHTTRSIRSWLPLEEVRGSVQRSRPRYGSRATATR